MLSQKTAPVPDASFKSSDSIKVLPETPVIWRSSPDYERARVGRVFNHRRPSRYPRGVIEATSIQDIINGVQLANREGIRVSVRSGGHSWAAWSVRDDAILIDLGKFKGIVYDEATQIVKVSPSTTGRMLNGVLVPKGRMFGGGHCPDVGLGGFLLQGGMGWNCKNWGWACERVVGIDVVTAEGKAIHCDKDQNSDLYWAARGSGPGFPAIVTAFYLETRQSYTNMKSSTFVYPISEYKPVMDWVQKVTLECDSSIEAVAVGAIDPLTKAPVIIAHLLSFQNSALEADASLKIFNDSHPPNFLVESMNEETSIAKEYDDQGAANPEGHRYVAENAYIKNDADVTEVLRKAMTTLPEGSKAFSLWFSMNPTSRRPLPDMALSMHTDHYFALYTVWEHEKDDERCKAWVKNIMKGVEPHTIGAYLGDSDFQVRQTKFWTDEKAQRLMEIRRKWDPKGTVCGFLDLGDTSGTKGLANVDGWES